MKLLVKKVVKKLIDKKIKIALAESCTGGMLSSLITSISGSSKIFTMGLITYSNQSKSKILKVPKKIIKTYGAVSKECCLSMVDNLKKISKSNICISITGIAGPRGGTKLKPIGLIFIGIKKGKKTQINKLQFKNVGRIKIQKATVVKSLKLIEKIIR